MVATFKEMCALTSRKYVLKQGMNVLESSGKHKCFGCTPPFSQTLIFEDFLTPEEIWWLLSITLVQLTSRKYVFK